MTLLGVNRFGRMWFFKSRRHHITSHNTTQSTNIKAVKNKYKIHSPCVMSTKQNTSSQSRSLRKPTYKSA